MNIASRRRALMMARSEIIWEWTPADGMANIEMEASSGETPLYTLLPDAMRLFGPNNSTQKWTGIATKDYLNADNFTVEVYYKNLTRASNGSKGVTASTHGAGRSSGYFGYAVYYANATGRPDAVATTLRGASTTSIQRSGSILQSSGVVKCHLNTITANLKGVFPEGYSMTDTPNTATSIANRRLCSLETNRQSYYVDITRIVVKRGDTT